MPCAPPRSRRGRAREDNGETTLTPARPAHIPTPTLRTSHFPDPPHNSLEPHSQLRLDTEGCQIRTFECRAGAWTAGVRSRGTGRSPVDTTPIRLLESLRRPPPRWRGFLVSHIEPPATAQVAHGLYVQVPRCGVRKRRALVIDSALWLNKQQRLGVMVGRGVAALGVQLEVRLASLAATTSHEAGVAVAGVTGVLTPRGDDATDRLGDLAQGQASSAAACVAPAVRAWTLIVESA
jgi:hypothetical protein